jgi:hypothetical protein
MKNLLQLQSATHLQLLLGIDQWLAVADGIRQGHCNIKHLRMVLLSSWATDETESVKAIASAIRSDRSLEHLTLQMNFTDEKAVALAEALKVNTTLRKITFSVVPKVMSNLTLVVPALSAPAYEAFSAMLRVNTSIVLNLPPFETDGADEIIVDSHNQMRIEQRLNEVGRGRLLSSSQTPRKEWEDALNELNSHIDETPEFNVSCLYSLLKLNPATCML